MPPIRFIAVPSGPSPAGSLALLIGVGAFAAFDWWWADALAALAMLPVIMWQGWETLGEARDAN